MLLLPFALIMAIAAALSHSLSWVFNPDYDHAVAQKTFHNWPNILP